MKNILMLLALLCLTHVPDVLAGDKGHGGDGLIMNGKPYLLDLVEAGVQRNPYFNPSVKPNAEIQSIVNEALPNFTSGFRQKLTLKLSEISVHSFPLALILAETLRNYSYRFVDVGLLNIKDEYSELAYDRKNLVQLAVRKDKIISIDRNYWSRLDLSNQVALIIHEIVYVYSPELRVPVFNDQNTTWKYVKSSDSARALTGTFFDSNTFNRGFKHFRKIIEESALRDAVLLDTGNIEDRFVVHREGKYTYIKKLSLKWVLTARDSNLDTDVIKETFYLTPQTTEKDVEHLVSLANLLYRGDSGYSYLFGYSEKIEVYDGYINHYRATLFSHKFVASPNMASDIVSKMVAGEYEWGDEAVWQ